MNSENPKMEHVPLCLTIVTVTIPKKLLQINRICVTLTFDSLPVKMRSTNILCNNTLICQSIRVSAIAAYGMTRLLYICEVLSRVLME